MTTATASGRSVVGCSDWFAMVDSASRREIDTIGVCCADGLTGCESVCTVCAVPFPQLALCTPKYWRRSAQGTTRLSSSLQKYIHGAAG